MNITVKKLAELHKPAHNIRRHSDILQGQGHPQHLREECITMLVVDIYVNKPVPVQDMEFTFVYDPAMVEAALHPPDSGQEQPFGAEKVL